MKDVDRIKALEERVAKLEQKRAGQVYYEQEVLKLARQYAQAKMLGYVNEECGRGILHPSDQERYARTFLDMLASAACSLVRADSDQS